ncbi:carboxypeptidase regulatory-like domain-containing protein [Candidatus Bathyarchaeota archaeon]|nr:carboxypeptidase regulatory-like domain-containing protein [Candidatus Bathyarchaeota archaeon]
MRRELRKQVICLIILIFLNFTASSINLASAITDYFIRGRVLNENGEGLDDVKVEIYFSGNDTLYDVTYTNSKGYFRFRHLPSSTYDVYFSKTGYLTKRVSLELTHNIDLGEIVLFKALKLYSSVLSCIATSGDEVTLPFTIENMGEEYEVVELSVSKPEGWSVRILEDQVGEVMKVGLPPSSSLALQLKVRIPSSFTGNGSLLLTATGKTSSTLNFTILVKPMEEPKVLRLYSEVLGRVANAGEELLIPFIVESELETTVTFDVSSPEGWGTKIVDESGELTKISLPSGGKKLLHLKIDIPKDAIGNYSLKLTAISNSGFSSSLEYAIAVKPPKPPRYDLELWTMTPVQVARAGSSVWFDVELRYSGVEERVFNPLLEGLPTNWRARFFYEEKEITCLALKSEASAVIGVYIEIPENAKEGDYLLNFIVSGGNLSEEIELKVILEPVKRGIKLDCTYPSLTTEAGTAVTYEITVTNEGDEDELIHFLTNTTSPDLDITFKATEVKVEAGGSLSLPVTVTTCRGITPGEYTIPVIAETKDKQLSDSITLKLKVKGVYKLTLRLTPLNVRVTAGRGCEVTASVYNEGQSTITNVNLEFDAPSGWMVSSKPENILRLEPGRSADFTVEVKPPPDALAADYYITVTATSDQAEPVSRDLRVTVEVPTGWGYFGAIAIIIIILAVIGVFLKFRRK